MSELVEGFSYRLKTYGCKVNTYDSGLLEKWLAEAGGCSSRETPRVHVLNTCAVTGEATKETLKDIRKLKSHDPGCVVVVTGCGAQVDTSAYEALAEADLIVANSHKGSLGQIISKYLSGDCPERVVKSNIFKKEDLEAGGGLESRHTRAFLKIQDGCNSFCTFCIIPFARGKSRSLSVDDLVGRIKELEGQGTREVVLTGVHIGDYEDETRVVGKNGLEDLIEAILEQTQMPRLRLTSLEPVELSARLLQLYKNERLCPHFHMSIQSATSRVLSDMKRKYSAEQVEQSLCEIERYLPRAFVGMDVIVGFPGETDQEFEETYQRLQSLPWTRIHVFPYSRRQGTFADRRADQCAEAVITERAQKLRSLSQQRYQEKAEEQLASEKQVLILRHPRKAMEGISRDYWPVLINNLPPGVKGGDEVWVKILDHQRDFSGEGRLVGAYISV